jgi:PHD/YefM family antitoxin component YafN of YafNO toxin-antitoxin module
MDQFRSYDFNATRLDDVGRTQMPVIIAVGQKQGGQLYVLPVATWRKMVNETYTEQRVKEAPRLNTGTNEGGMTEPELMRVLTHQVGEGGHISGGELAVVTRRSKDAAYIVPRSAYWRKMVEADQ